MRRRWTLAVAFGCVVGAGALLFVPAGSDAVRALASRTLDAGRSGLDALATAGRARADQLVLVGSEGDWLDDSTLVGSGWIRDPWASWERWREAGADGAIVTAKSDADIDALVEAAGRW